MPEITKVDLLKLETLSVAQVELVLRKINLLNPSTLNSFTNRLASFIDHEASREIYKEVIRQLVEEMVDKYKKHIPRWIPFKGRIAKKATVFLLKYMIGFVVGFLRKMGT